MSGMEGSPVAPNAPKFGTLVPNRLFVGGISASTTEAELAGLFSKFGNVRAAKIIADRAGVSKGYGFVTFETEEEARRIQKEGDKLILKDRKLNIAPAIKKQPFTRIAASETPPPLLKDSPATPLYLEPPPVLANGNMLYNNLPPPHYSYGAYYGDPAVFGAFPAAAPAPQVPMYYPTVPPGPYYLAASPQYPMGNIMYCSVLGAEPYYSPLLPAGGSEASSSKSSEAASPPPGRHAEGKPFRPL